MRQLRWYECLTALKPKTEGTQEQYDNGKYVHAILQNMHPELNREKERYFQDPELPFEICYHPDLYDPERQILWEIKPSNFFFRHYDYCLAQISGYKHFTGAQFAGFMIYRLRTTGKPKAEDIDGPYPFEPRAYWSWEDLRAIAIKSDAQLLASQS